MLLPTINGRPVLLPSHNDVELDQPIIHYHVDPRYHTGEDAVIVADKGEEIVYMEFSDDEAEPKEMNFGIAIYLQLLAIYEGRKLCGTRCPHRGVEVFHHGQCMGHGLRFDEDSKVKGRLCESYLWLPGTKNRSANGDFKTLHITHFVAKVNEVWLMHTKAGGDVFLAKNRIGPVPAVVGDMMKLNFSVNTKTVTPEPCAPQMSDTKERLALRLAPETGEVV